jgi:FHS family Na+ dependent glucose MFS transporter 1
MKNAAVLAESAAPRSARSTEQTIGYYAAYCVLGLLISSLGPTLPALAGQTQAPLAEISYVFMARSLGFILGALAAGRIYDRVKGHPVLAGGLFALAALAACVPGVSLLWLLVILFLLQGLFGSAVGVGGNAQLLWANRGRTGPLLGGLHFIWGAGAFAAPIIVARAMQHGGVGLAYWILAALALPVCVWLLRLPSPLPPHKSADHAPGEVRISFAVMIWFFLFLYTGTEAVFGNWIYTYAVKTGLGTTTGAAYLNSAFWGSLTLGRLSAIPLALRLRPRSILTIDLCGCLASVMVMLLWRESSAALWIGICGVGFSMASIFPTTISFAQNRMPLSGNLTGILFAGSSAGAMSMPWVVGQFFESVGPQMMLLMALGGLMIEVGIFILMMLFPRRAERETAAPPPDDLEPPGELGV